MLVSACLLAGALLSMGLTGAAGSGTPADPGAGSDRVIVCESGVVDHGGGVATSSIVATRVAAEDAPPPEELPPDCRYD